MYSRMRYPRSCFCLFVLATFGLVLAGSSSRNLAQGASSAPYTGNGVIRLGGGNWGTLSNTDKYSVLLASANNANAAGALPGRSLMYACGTNTDSSDSSSAACGVPYTDAVANNWILKDASGNYVHYKGTSVVLLDIGNTSYQQRFIADIDADLRTHPGLDGLWLDDITGSLYNSTPISTTYPDNASFRAAMLSFMNAVGPALKAKGWYVAVNASILDGAIESVTGPSWDGSQYIWWVNQIAPDIDGVTMEHWQQNWSSGDPVRVAGSAGNQAWDGWQRLVSAVQGLGKQFIPIGYGALSDVTKSAYLKGSFLLDWNGGQGAFVYSDNYSGTGDPWNPAWTADIGQPSAAKSRVGVGWLRTFTGGIVVVNPSPSSSQTFALGATYLTPSGISTSSVTLSPATAMILRSTSLALSGTTTTTTTTTTAATTTATMSTTTPATTTTTTSMTTPTTTASTTTPTPQPGWTFCAWEWGHCGFTGAMEVHYGANGVFTSPRTFTGGVDCTNAVFGDPLLGIDKWCEMRAAATTTTTTSTTTPTTTTTTTTTTAAAATATATSPPPTNSKPPAITGPDLVAKSVNASQGSWDGATSFAYIWSRCDATGRNCVAITAANSSTYLIDPTDEGRTLVVTVIATNAGGSAFASSTPTAIVRNTVK